MSWRYSTLQSGSALVSQSKLRRSEIKGTRQGDIEYEQGDIFQVGMREKRDMMVVFGHIGLNQMNLMWGQFRKESESFSNVDDPFKTFVDKPKEYRPGKWVWFIGPTRNHGMSDRKLTEVLTAALLWADKKALRRIITNGIMNTDHGTSTAANKSSDANRVALIKKIVGEHKHKFDSLKLISLNEAYLRDAT
jgi:hypothetical protein